MHGVQLGFLSFMMKACCYAITQQPIINAVIHQNEIVYRNFIDINVTVSTPSGIIEPRVKNAESKGFIEIEKEL